MEEFLVGYLVFWLIFYFLGLAFSIAMYVLQSLGLYTIAKRRGIDKPWLAWIPVAFCWTVGCISDQYQYVVKGKNKSRRKVLIGTQIGQAVGALIFYIGYFVSIFRLVGSAGSFSEEEMVLSVFGMLGTVLLLMLPMLACSIVYSVFFYICSYDIYSSCNPEHAVVFLVLDIFVGATRPFFLFFNRKKDLGMPPRREPVQAIPSQTYQVPPNWQPPQV